MTTRYDLADGPVPSEWLALDEGARVALVQAAHEAARAKTGANPHAHAAIHVAVENQLAEGAPHAVAAYERFRAAGVGRHNTVHALASVVTRHMLTMLETGSPVDAATAERDFADLDPTAYQRRR